METPSFRAGRSHMLNVFNKYPDHAPVILKPIDFKLAKTKFLIKKSMTFNQAISAFRTRNEILSNQAYFFFNCNNQLIQSSDTIGNIWALFGNIDKVLYISVRCESTFG